MVEQSKCLGNPLANQNAILEVIKSRLKSSNARYHSVQDFFSFSLLSKNLKFEVHSIIILTVVLYGCETWSLTVRRNVS
jgi:hypothetical protein